MKRENDGKPPAQPRHGSQIEISTVQIMAVQDIWRARRQVQELPGARKAKIFPTAPLIDGPARVGDGVEEAAGLAAVDRSLSFMIFSSSFCSIDDPSCSSAVGTSPVSLSGRNGRRTK